METKTKYDDLPIFESGEKAARNLPPLSLFVDDSNCIRRVTEFPGENLTRGQYGNIIYSEFAMIWDYDEDLDSMNWVYFNPPFHNESHISWKVWDSDFGWL